MSSSIGIFAKAEGSIGGLLANLVNTVGTLLGGVTDQGSGAQVQVGSLASVSINKAGGTGNLAQVSASTSHDSSGASSLSADVQGLIGSLAGGLVTDLGSLLGGLSGTPGTGFALSVGSLVSIGINETPAKASLLSLGINTDSLGSSSLGGGGALGL